MTTSKEIHWPEYYHPKNAQLHVRNETLIPATADAIWSSLIHAPCWPQWGRAKTSVQIINGDGVELHKGTIFRWRARAVHFDCTVVEYIPHERIAWKGKCGDVDMYHAWLIEPTDDGCVILTESTQRGGMTWLTKYFTSRNIHSYHRRWLDELKQQPECQKRSSIGNCSKDR